LANPARSPHHDPRAPPSPAPPRSASPASLAGPQVVSLGKQPLGSTHTPLTVCNGVVGCRLKSGAMDNVTLESHKLMQPNDAVARSMPAKK
jgi:WD repeat-containing protein 19